jgi:hypothetical protein
MGPFGHAKEVALFLSAGGSGNGAGGRSTWVSGSSNLPQLSAKGRAGGASPACRRSEAQQGLRGAPGFALIQKRQAEMQPTYLSNLPDHRPGCPRFPSDDIASTASRHSAPYFLLLFLCPATLLVARVFKINWRCFGYLPDYRSHCRDHVQYY